MRKLLRRWSPFPSSLIFIVFPVQPPHFVTVSFDPFGSGNSAFNSPPVPLFVIILSSLILGVAAGSVWFRQRSAPRGTPA